MTSMTKFIDANIFIERWNNERVAEFLNNLNRDDHCTSVLVLSEVYHKLMKKNITDAFHYIRTIMGAIKVHDVFQDDLFFALKLDLPININDRIHLAVMKRNGLSCIISYDADFDHDTTITREEI